MSQINTPPPLSTYGGDRPRGARASKWPGLFFALLLLVIAMLGVLLFKVTALQRDMDRAAEEISRVCAVFAVKETTAAPTEPVTSAPQTTIPQGTAPAVTTPGTTAQKSA